MNWHSVEGNLKQLTGRIKREWGELTDDPSILDDGRRDELVGKIQEAYGISHDEAAKKVKEWEWDHSS